MKKFRIYFITKILISASLILLGIQVFSGSASECFFFLDFPGLIYVVLGAVSITLMGFSFQEIGAALCHALGSSKETEKRKLEKSVYFWEAVARNFFLMGVLISVIGFFILIKNLANTENFWQTLAICFVTTLYGLILALLSAIAGWRVNKKLAGLEQPLKEIKVELTEQKHNWNIEKVIGAFFFIGTVGWAIMIINAWKIFIHWPPLLIVAGGAILAVIWVGNGKDGFSTTFSFAFTGIIGIFFGIVQLFYNSFYITGIEIGMTFSLLSCIYALLGIMLGGVHCQDNAVKTGKTHKQISISRLIWYGFPIVVLMLMLYVFLLMIIPIAKAR